MSEAENTDKIAPPDPREKLATVVGKEIHEGIRAEFSTKKKSINRTADGVSAVMKGLATEDQRGILREDLVEFDQLGMKLKALDDEAEAVIENHSGDLTEETNTWIRLHGRGGDVDFTQIPPHLVDTVLNTYMNGFGTSYLLRNMARQAESLPDINDANAKELFDLVARSGNKVDATLFLSRYNAFLDDPELTTKLYSHPDAVVSLMRDRPDMATFMANAAGERQSRLIEMYDNLDTDELRTSFEHHVDVITDEDAQDWAKNVSHAALKLGAIDGDFGAVKAGEINYDSGFKPRDNIVADIGIPMGAVLPHVEPGSVGIPKAKLFKDMSRDEKLFVASDAFIQAHEGDIDGLDSIPLPDLRPNFQELVLQNTLLTSIEMSNNPGDQQQASERNKQLAESGTFIKTGDLVHTTRLPILDTILENGLICGELLGEKSINDAYPFNVDFNRVGRGEVTDDFSATMKAATEGRHTANERGLLTLVVNRKDENKFADRAADNQKLDHKHRLIFGAVPATEISAVVLSDNQQTGQTDSESVQRAIDTVVSHGIYIPVVSGQGELLLTFEDFTNRLASQPETSPFPKSSDKDSTNEEKIEDESSLPPIEIPDGDV
jgi:hypothetical protein